MTVSLTPLPPGAAVPLSLLHAACFPDEPWDAAALGRILALAGCFGWVAWRQDEPVGFILARDLGEECEILSLGVVPQWCRRGIGAALLRAACGEARQRALRSMVLEVAADNGAARHLYTACGFVAVGRRPRYYRRRDGLADALILRLALADPAPIP